MTEVLTTSTVGFAFIQAVTRSPRCSRSRERVAENTFTRLMRPCMVPTTGTDTSKRRKGRCKKRQLLDAERPLDRVDLSHRLLETTFAECAAFVPVEFLVERVVFATAEDLVL